MMSSQFALKMHASTFLSLASQEGWQLQKILVSQDSLYNVYVFPSSFPSCPLKKKKKKEGTGILLFPRAWAAYPYTLGGCEGEGVPCCDVSSAALVLWGAVSPTSLVQARHTNHSVYVAGPWYTTFPWCQSGLRGMPDWKGQALLVRLKRLK